jgi:hypothetical protein
MLGTQVDTLNAVVNDPDVLPYVAPGYATLDMSLFFSRPGNLMFGDEAGVVLMAPHDETPSIYEMHNLMTLRKRGKAAKALCQEAIDYVFTGRGASAIYGHVPRDNLPARVMARALGGRPSGTITDTQGRSCILFVLERALWATSSAVSSGALAH